MNSNLKNFLKQTDIVCSNMNDLVVQGIANILNNGVRVSAKSKHCLQAYNVSYTLTNPLDRVFTLRRPYSIALCRELLAFFKGSLKVHDGLSNASKFWEKIADKNGKINSNYGHYVFHIQLPEANNQTQYDWVVSCFREDLDTRQALVNISQINHKTSDILDFPCTLGLQF